MAMYIKNIEIENYRGLRDLKINNLNQINIIAGDNNSGKTSVFEVIMLLANPMSLNNVIEVANIRDNKDFFDSPLVYRNFINLFPMDLKHKHIEFKVELEKGDLLFKLEGYEELNTVKAEYSLGSNVEGERISVVAESSINLVDVNTFVGNIYCEYDGKIYSQQVKVSEDKSIESSVEDPKRLFNISYLSTTNNNTDSVLNYIDGNTDYKGQCLEVLRQFDNDIEDLVVVESKKNKKLIECIKHSKFGVVPINTYGKGIKCFLAIANILNRSKDGILIIDDIEVSIHKKYYEVISSFISEMTKLLNIQLFISTNSMELIDGFLAVQEYDEIEDDENVSILKFKRIEGHDKTFSRTLSGRGLYTQRKYTNFEARI